MVRPRPLGLAHDSTDMTAAFPAQDDIRIAVIGLGYVGLPLAAAFGRRYPTVGFDIDPQRIAQLRERHYPTLELLAAELKGRIGRASVRERVDPYVMTSGGPGT